MSDENLDFSLNYEANTSELEQASVLLEKQGKIISNVEKQLKGYAIAGSDAAQQNIAGVQKQIEQYRQLEKELARLEKAQGETKDPFAFSQIGEEIKQIEGKLVSVGKSIEGSFNSLEKPVVKAGDALKTVFDTLGKASDALGPLGSGLSKASSLLEEIGSAAGPVAALAIAIPALGAGLSAVIAQLFKFTQGAAETKKETDELSRLTGVANDLAVALRLAGQSLSDPASLGDLKDGIVQLQQAQKGALANNLQLKESLKDLGVTNFTSTEQALEQIGLKLKTLGGSAQALGLQFSTVFGEEGGRQFIEILRNLDEAKVRAAKYGLVISDEVAPQLEKLTKLQADFKAQIEGASTIVGGRFAGSFATALEQISKTLDKLRESQSFKDGLENISNFLDQIITGPLPSLVDLLAKTTEEITSFAGFLSILTVGANDLDVAIRKLPSSVNAVVKEAKEAGKEIISAADAIKILQTRLDELEKRTKADTEGIGAVIKQQLIDIEEQERKGVLSAVEAAQKRNEILEREAERKRNDLQQGIKIIEEETRFRREETARSLNAIAKSEAELAQKRIQQQAEVNNALAELEQKRANGLRDLNNRETRLTQEQQDANLKQVNEIFKNDLENNERLKKAKEGLAKVDESLLELANRRASNERNLSNIEKGASEERIKLRAKEEEANAEVATTRLDNAKRTEAAILADRERAINEANNIEKKAIEDIQKLRSSGAITEQEYQKRLTEIQVKADQDRFKAEQSALGEFSKLKEKDAEQQKKLEQNTADASVKLEQDTLQRKYLLSQQYADKRIADIDHEAAVRDLKLNKELFELKQIGDERSAQLLIGKESIAQIDDELSKLRLKLITLIDQKAAYEDIRAVQDKINSGEQKRKQTQDDLNKAVAQGGDFYTQYAADVSQAGDKVIAVSKAIGAEAAKITEELKIPFDVAKASIQDLKGEFNKFQSYLEGLQHDIAVSGTGVLRVFREEIAKNNIETLFNEISKRAVIAAQEAAAKIKADNLASEKSSLEEALKLVQDHLSKRQAIQASFREKIQEGEQKAVETFLQQLINLANFEKDRANERLAIVKRRNDEEVADEKRKNQELESQRIELRDRLNDIDADTSQKSREDRKSLVQSQADIEVAIFENAAKQKAATSSEELARLKEEASQLAQQLSKAKSDREELAKRDAKRISDIEAAKKDAAERSAKATTAEERSAIQQELEERIKGINEKFDIETRADEELKKYKGKVSAETLAALKQGFLDEIAEVNKRQDSEIQKIRESAAQKKAIADQEAAEKKAARDKELSDFDAQTDALRQKQIDANKQELDRLKQHNDDLRKERKRALAQEQSDFDTALDALKGNALKAGQTVSDFINGILAKGSDVKSLIDSIKDALAQLSQAQSTANTAANASQVNTTTNGNTTTTTAGSLTNKSKGKGKSNATAGGSSPTSKPDNTTPANTNDSASSAVSGLSSAGGGTGQALRASQASPNASDDPSEASGYRGVMLALYDAYKPRNPKFDPSQEVTKATLIFARAQGAIGPDDGLSGGLADLTSDAIKFLINRKPNKFANVVNDIITVTIKDVQPPSVSATQGAAGAVSSNSNPKGTEPGRGKGKDGVKQADTSGLTRDPASNEAANPNKGRGRLGPSDTTFDADDQRLLDDQLAGRFRTPAPPQVNNNLKANAQVTFGSGSIVIQTGKLTGNEIRDLSEKQLQDTVFQRGIKGLVMQALQDILR